MLKLRTKLLLVLMFGFGLGIGILSGLHDGLYSAACLFVLPLLVVLAAASIISDLSHEQPGKVEVQQTEKERPDANWATRRAGAG